jgi:hypothetical protein
MQDARLSGINGELRATRLCLQALDHAFRRLVPLLTAAMQNGTRAERPRRLSTKARSALVLQGRYMGFMRQLKPRHKAQVRSLKGSKGVRAAIAKARALAGRATR